MPPAFANDGIVDVTVGVVNHGDQMRTFDVDLDDDDGTTETNIDSVSVIDLLPGEWS